MNERDYGNEVYRLYKLKRDHDQLSFNMLHATCKRIRTELAAVLYRCSKSDISTIRAYMRVGEDSDLCVLLKRSKPDRFKALLNYLRSDGKKNFSIDNAELLALLIDYKNRPFNRYFSEKLTRMKEQYALPGSNARLTDQEIDHNEVSLETAMISEEVSKNILDQKKVTIEFPSGIKIHVHQCEDELIMQLVALAKDLE